MENSFDIDFEVPFRHRVRFTENLAENDTGVLLDLLESPSEIKPRVLIVVDDQLLENSGRVAELIEKLENNQDILLLDGGSTERPGPAFVLPGGETAKNSTQYVEQLLSLINERNLDRRSYIVVIGGGAVLDAACYASAIAHRGIRVIRIPTTTLAQGDSGVGVKNAINFFRKKNWIGTFAVPWAVINDAALLTTLPSRDFRCGFSEAIKVSLLKSENDFDELCRNAKQIANREMDVAFAAIKKSCLWHLKHITRGGDPFEALEARPLDFGHWSAHKMEQMSGYRLRHGEAVGIGVAIDCIYSSRVFGFPEEDMRRVIKCLEDFRLPLWDSTLNDFDALLGGLEEFRQHLGGRLTITMLEEVGDPIDVHEIDADQMRASIEELRGLAVGSGSQR
ncbi:3-dehydroquinate synthase [Mariniblastus fucicola]|uniref:3-dehydroquinate synthase n=1 Tax=Mariniblastus fucicola TaxID=980251 RepID=A0A5B9PBT0_9BACT|nr:3-dehydroquinate synthase [Mariniblastus fucicola]QEG20623.1 3-dehydroquinate synthase [Mariniblastus fucicola]